MEVDVFTNGILRPAHLSPQLETIHGVHLCVVGEAAQVQVARNEVVELFRPLLKRKSPQVGVELARAGLHLYCVVDVSDGLLGNLQVDHGRGLPELVQDSARLRPSRVGLEEG